MSSSVLKKFFTAMEADFDIFDSEASKKSFDDADTSLEHPSEPEGENNDENENKSEDNNDNTENDELSDDMDEDSVEDEDEFSDEDLGEETEGENEEVSEEDQEEKVLKQRLKENFIYLYDILVSNIESMESGKYIRPEFDTEKFLIVKNHLIQLKELIYKIITIEFDNCDSTSLRKKYISAERVYDVATNMLEVYFEEGLANMSTKTKSKKR